jgi:hypothetical protein
MQYDGTLLNTEDFLQIRDREPTLNFFTFKWGDKYGPEYVNRLYGSLLQHCSIPFSFSCITDDCRGIKKEILAIDYNKFGPDSWREYPQDRIFTREKLCLFDLDIPGTKCWIDLDVLIHSDITHLVDRKFKKPTFIYNYWNVKKNGLNSFKWFGKGSDCHLNSSFVCWQDAQWLFDYTNHNKEKLFFTYKSLDKYLYYQHWRNDRLGLWEDGIVDNFNFSDPPFVRREDVSITLFNTSHIKANNLDIEAFELHETQGQWPMRIWEGYG